MSNNVTVVANVSIAPDLRYTQSGAAVVSFSVADSTSILDKATNTWKDGVPDFIRVEVWNSLAENVAASITKGQEVIIIGRYVSEKYVNKEGKEVITRKLKADAVGPNLKFAVATVEKKRSNSGGYNANSEAPARTSAESNGWPSAPSAGAAAGFDDNTPF